MDVISGNWVRVKKNEISKGTLFTIGGFLGYTVGSFTFGLFIHPGFSLVCLLFGWLIWPAATIAFIGGGITALILAYLKRNNSAAFWPLSLILGANIGTAIGLSFLFPFNLPFQSMLYMTFIGIITGASIGLYVWFK